MDNNFRPLDPESVIKLSQEDDSYKVPIRDMMVRIGGKIFEVGDMTRTLVSIFGNNELLSYLTDGLPCKVLELGKSSWQSGKIRISIQFMPDEVISPLDEIRNNND